MATKLSKEKFERAKTYIMERGRNYQRRCDQEF
jgi:hypothetical protein